MLILADNDVGGAVVALRRILESVEWATFSAMLDLRFIEFTDVGLARDASDPLVWHTYQEVGAVLITANRASGDASLEHTIPEHAGADSLPVVTIGDPQRVIRDPAYAQECAISLGEIHAHHDSPEVERAEDVYQQAMTLAVELGMGPLQAHCLLGLGMLSARLSRREQARTELSAAIEL
jgi:hypothetical protein